MNNLNTLHPMTRYGIGAALVRFGTESFDIQKESDLWTLAHSYLQDLLSTILLEPHPAKQAGSIHYKFLPGDKLEPGKAGGQNAPNGFFIAPHITTSNNAADIFKEAKALIKLLEEESNRGKNYELKRSFAPMISKLNAGKKSMSNPKIDVLDAAFTCIATLTPLKPAAFVKSFGDKFSNAALIPDLPLIDDQTGERPLVQFIELFYSIIKQGTGENAYIKASTKEKKYNRPDIFYGNYPNRPQSYGLGVVSLMAAIGKWTLEHKELNNTSIKVMSQIQNRPIYITAYTGTTQERFGHHLVALAMSGQLHSILKKTFLVSLIGTEEQKKFGDPKWQLFIRSLDQFLRFFNESSWQNFFAFRATYPIEFFHLLKPYFMKDGKYSEEIIDSAVVYGQELNRSAFFAAKSEIASDKKEAHDGRTLNEYKHRVLLQLESIINSAENGSELVSRLNSQVARLVMKDISKDAGIFLKNVVNNQIDFSDAKHLITAFMRLSTYDSNKHSASNEDNPEMEILLGPNGEPIE